MQPPPVLHELLGYLNSLTGAHYADDPLTGTRGGRVECDLTRGLGLYTS